MKPKYCLLFLLSFYILNCTLYIEAQATVRYVSKTGTSTPPYTSWQTAADSIQKCINLCIDGDTVYVDNGIYKENLIINTALFLIGLSTDSTIIDGTNLGNTTISINANVFIKNLNIYGKGDGIGDAVIRSNINDLQIRDARISKCAIGISSVDGSVILKSLFMKNVRTGISLLSASNFYSYLIDSCVFIMDNGNSHAINIGFAVKATATISNNLILFTGTQHINDIGIYCGLPKKVSIYNNLISGFGVNIYMDGIEDTAFIKQNVLAGSGAGILTDGISVANNVVLINNNIGVANYSAYNKFNYNIFWKNNRNFSTIIAYGDSDLIADPMFLKDTIANPQLDFDYHLQAFSPAIDKGDPNILDVDGSRSDIGMYGGPFGETYTYQDLAPLAPRNLSAVVDTNTILVKWNRNTEADISYYKVYRDTVSGFTIDSTKLVSSSADTFFIQPNPHINTRCVYKVTCVDNQNNESKPSLELVVNITSVSANDYPMTISDYVLYQNYPNPFNPSTKIGYQLKERAYVKLMVYDIKGELVSVLVNKEQNAGYYETEFNVGNGLPSVPNTPSIASGIYLYRIEVIGEGKIPVYTEMKKMILVK